MSDSTRSDGTAGVNRRKVLECMTWAGTGVLWTNYPFAVQVRKLHIMIFLLPAQQRSHGESTV